MIARLPPVGHRVRIARAGALPRYPGYEETWLDSGTSALALAIKAACARRPEVTAPEVILPAYGCPDLVAASVHAGVRVVLADISPDDPGFSLEALEAAISPRTVAVVAVNFLGIAERLASIRHLLRRHGDIALIEDNAQWYPEVPYALEGDYVCLSFGRGKPVSVLSGGALLRSLAAPEAPAIHGVAYPARPSRGEWELRLYNWLLHPLLYGLLCRIPGTQLGATRYDELREVAGFPPERLSLLMANVEAHLQRTAQVEERLSNALRGIAGLIDLTATLAERKRRLLRLPVLMDTRADRDRAAAALTRAGIGATHFYGAPLARIEGVGGLVVAGDAPGASAFAARLITLPVHGQVGERQVELIATILAKSAA